MTQPINKYPILKTRVIELLKTGAAPSFDVDIQKDNLVIGIILPDVYKEREAVYNRLVLKPYELAVRQNTNADFVYDQMAINAPGKRTFNNLATVWTEVPAAATMLTIIITYLEF